jgi:hypothetical protein
LPHPKISHISADMRVIVVLLGPLLVVPAGAQVHQRQAAAAQSESPKALGQFEDWVAATYQEAGHTVCYAFAQAKNSVPAIPKRGEVVLTVTERPASRDWVAISAGFAYPKGAAVTLQVDTTGLDFYSTNTSAFARDGKATVAALQKGSQALARSPGPREGQVVVDTFSLRGFSAAYAAISKACPVR